MVIIINYILIEKTTKQLSEKESKILNLSKRGIIIWKCIMK